MNNQPAFPCPAGHAQITDYQPGVGEFHKTVEICQTGMTLRDHFAGQALKALLQNHVANRLVIDVIGCDPNITRRQWFAEQAYSFADAMLVEREKEVK